MELRPAHGERRHRQIDILDLQIQCLGDSESGSCDEPEKCLIGHGSQPTWRRHAVRQGQQIANLLIGVDVWGQSSMAVAQDEWGRHLSGGLELEVIGRKRSDDLQPARCRNGTRSCDMLARPI